MSDDPDKLYETSIDDRLLTDTVRSFYANQPTVTAIRMQSDAESATPYGRNERRQQMSSSAINSSRMFALGNSVNAISAVPLLLNTNDSSPPSLRTDDIVLLEKQYLLSCERGDLGSVRAILNTSTETREHINLNCVDSLGRTALLIAIENENIEMIEVLLDANIETGDAILYAIGEENVEAVEIILNHLERNDKFDSATQGVEINEHSAFTPDMTPIILAAHKDNYECIKLLLDKGASIPHPHDVRCSCKDCLQSNSEDSLRLSRSRINAYRALASASLICLSVKDPILYAFELSWELRRLSSIENEFRSEYQELSQTCQKLSVNMLDQVRGSKELEIILNQDTSDRWPLDKEYQPGTGRMQLARLKLAVQFGQKRVRIDE